MKRKILLLFTTFFAVTACSGVEEDNVQATVQNSTDTEINNNEDLIERMPYAYREYYPGKKQLKLAGGLDKDEKRNGPWKAYFENGQLNSMTYYVHGKKHGHSVVNHPNGQVFYMGEYKDDERVGTWLYYDESGQLLKEENF
jgi:antitoxin component YwqK of YwqJK toxin-antitoxin module